MHRAKTRFENSIIGVNNNHSLFEHLSNDLGFDESVVSDILRFELVNLVAALDRLIHDLVLTGIIEIYSGTRSSTPSFDNFQLTLSQHITLTRSSFLINELSRIIINKHKYLAFQEPDKIAKAISLIWNEPHKWQKISDAFSIPEADVKITLKNIVIRRNQIVHESDIDLFSGSLLPIIKSDVEESIVFVEKLGTQIYSLLI